MLENEKLLKIKVCTDLDFGSETLQFHFNNINIFIYYNIALNNKVGAVSLFTNDNFLKAKLGLYYLFTLNTKITKLQKYDFEFNKKYKRLVYDAKKFINTYKKENINVRRECGSKSIEENYYKILKKALNELIKKIEEETLYDFY